jgi:hypothetical protein
MECPPIKGADVEDVEATSSVHQHLREARGADDRADHERVAPRMWDAIGVIPLVEGDGR